jgi:hypothetical protein
MTNTADETRKKTTTDFVFYKLFIETLFCHYWKLLNYFLPVYCIGAEKYSFAIIIISLKHFFNGKILILINFFNP